MRATRPNEVLLSAWDIVVAMLDAAALEPPVAPSKPDQTLSILSPEARNLYLRMALAAAKRITDAVEAKAPGIRVVIETNEEDT